MLELNFNNLLFVLISFNLLFISCFAFFYKKGKPYANKLFAVFLLAKVLCFTTNFFLINYNYSIGKFVNIFYLGLSFDLLLGPLMVFYLKSLTHKKFRFKYLDILHLVPFVMHLSYMFVIYYSNNAIEKQQLIESGRLFTRSFIIINDICIYLSFIIYFIFIIREIRAYHKNIKNIYVNFNKMQMNWMASLSAGLACIWLLAIVNNTLRLFNIHLNLPLSAFIIPIFIFVNIIFFYGLRYSQAFGGINDEDSLIKYQKTSLPEDKKSEILERLLQYFETNKPYLEPDININKLANELSIPAYQISQILNSKLKKNFFEFISYYRIKESMTELSKPDNSSKTILEILYEVGFNSKSAFNNAFKKHTGVTPTQYKKQPEMVKIPSIYN